ncbi:redox-sensing transcriptional repressor Rex, partial [Planctomycetota bacterium]
ILGKDKVRRFVLVGMGNLGRTLVRYGGFETSGIKIVAGFDIDAAQYNEEGNIPILPLERITDYIGNQNIEFAIIAVPDFAAQQVLELMLPAGIKGVLNFAPICLKGPEGCVINNINLVTELENIIYFVNAARQTKEC